jgi:hypothetical protein
MFIHPAGILLAAAWTVLVSVGVQADIHVTQSRYDRGGTGANLQETVLNTGNVNPRQFGFLGSYPVDGDIYAQPLYVSGVDIPGRGSRNVLFIATMHDVIYAYDADQTGEGSLLWQRDLRDPAAGIGPVPVAPLASNRNIRRFMGIESTPVIDTRTQTLYLVARTLERGTYVQRLHALELASGQDKTGSPVTIGGEYQGLTFNPKFQHQRAGLVMASGQIIITWAADAIENSYPYHGWIMAHDAKTLKQTGRWTTTTSRLGGGIWASGRAPAVIDNPQGGEDIIVFTGNAIKTTQGYDGKTNFAESILRLRVAPETGDNAITLIDWFTPDNWQKLDKLDLDLGGSGPVILPGSGYIVGGGKEGVLYVVDPNRMGKLQKGNAGLVQSFRAVPKLHIMGGGVVWDRTSQGLPLQFYHWGESDYLRAFTFTGNRFDLNQTRRGKDYIDSHPGGILTLSANGSEPGSGIVWAWGSHRGNAIRTVRQGILRAYDAGDIHRLLWSSRMNTRDDGLAFAKFTPPTVANGKVYLATFSDQVRVYGLLPTERPRPVYVALESRISQYHLESTEASRFPGSPLTLAQASTAARQRFELKNLPNGDRALVSAVSDLRMDDGLAASPASGTVRLWPQRQGLAAVAQAWIIEPAQDGYIRLRSRATGRVLSAGQEGHSLSTHPPVGDLAEDWKMIRYGEAGVSECDTSALQFVSALPGNPLLTMDDRGEVKLKKPDSSARQQWLLGDISDTALRFYSAADPLWLSRQNGTVTTETATDSAWIVDRIASPLETFSRIRSGADDAVLTVDNSKLRDDKPVLMAAPADTSATTGRNIWRIQDIHSLECLYPH